MSTETKSEGSRSRWLLPALCGVLLAAAGAVWVYQHLWALGVLRREESARGIGCIWSGQPSGGMGDIPVLRDYWPGMRVDEATIYGPRKDATELVAALRHFSGLRRLSFGSTDAPAAHMNDIQPAVVLGLLKHSDGLKMLTLSNTGNGDATMPSLAHLQSLEKFTLIDFSENVTGETFPQLPRITGLVFSSRVSDLGLARLATLPALQELAVSGKNITLAGIEQALKAAAPTLRKLEVYAPELKAIERAAIEALVRRQPPGRKLVIYSPGLRNTADPSGTVATP